MLLCYVQTNAVDELLNKHIIHRLQHIFVTDLDSCHVSQVINTQQISTTKLKLWDLCDVTNTSVWRSSSHRCDVSITQVWQSLLHRCDGRVTQVWWNHHTGVTVVWLSHLCDGHTGVTVVITGHTGVTLERRQLTSVQCVFTALSQLCL